MEALSLLANFHGTFGSATPNSALSKSATAPSAQRCDILPSPIPPPPASPPHIQKEHMPYYFSFLTIMAVHVFVKEKVKACYIEAQAHSSPSYAHSHTHPNLSCTHPHTHPQVDAAVFEVGIGGAYDCTNIVRLAHLMHTHAHTHTHKPCLLRPQPQWTPPTANPLCVASRPWAWTTWAYWERPWQKYRGRRQVYSR